MVYMSQGIEWGPMEFLITMDSRIDRQMDQGTLKGFEIQLF